METNNKTEIKKIFLMMGPACNFQCRYCLQQPEKEAILTSNISPSVYQYLEELAASSNRRIRISFWGGEPLLYWNIIKDIVLRYEFMFAYSIISNGSLLTDEIVSFINDHDILFTLSHDGKNTKQSRNIDVLGNPVLKERLQRIESFHLNAVLSGANENYNELFNYWEQTIPYSSGNIEMIRHTWNMPEDLADINIDHFKTGLRAILKEAGDDIINNRYNPKRDFVWRLLRQVIRAKTGKQYHFPKCWQTEHILNIDLNGNIYACHNSSIIIGHISQPRDQYIDAYKTWLKTKVKSECETCSAKYFCQGGCPLDINNKACIIQQTLYKECVDFLNNNKKIEEIINGSYR